MILCIGRDDLIDIAERDQRGVGVRAVDDDLRRRRDSLAQFFGEAGLDDDRDDRVGMVDRLADVGRGLGDLDDAESAR